MMQTPKISIIVPVYNTEKYLEQCLGSLLAQTYKNLEIICVNDGSNDNSKNILEHYKNLDERINVINQENQGQSEARNKGIENATGEWITFVDSDDWVKIDCYEKFYKALNEKEFDIFMFNGVSFNEKGKDLALRDFFRIENWSKTSGEIITFKDCKNPFEGNLSVYNKIYKKKFLDSLNLKFEKFSLMEDELFWIKAFGAAKSIYLCDEIFYFYRQQKKSVMHNVSENVFEIFQIFNKIKHLLVDSNYYAVAKYAFLQHKFRQYAFFFSIIPSEFREDFYNKAKLDLMQNKDFDENIIRRLKDFPLYFAFLNMNSKEFYDKFILVSQGD